MMKSKSVFLRTTVYIICLLLAACQDQACTLTILHTNDTHSQVEPIEDGKKDGNHAGYARRMGFIQQERKQNPNLLLLDAGDFTQGTPYFNYFHGRIEVDAFNRMGYDAITLGNHEFDNGVDTLAKVLQLAQFPIVSANYDVKGTPLEKIVQPYTIIKKSGLRIGVFGLGINPEGLISEKNFAPVKYLEPISVAQDIATSLKQKHLCDAVICLSHLGTYSDDPSKPSDAKLAKETRHIDVIIGAHTHKILTNHYVKNLDGDSVLLAQMGKSGARIGKITLKMDK